MFYSTLLFVAVGILIWDVAGLSLAFQPTVIRSMTLGALFGTALYLFLGITAYKIKPIAKLLKPLFQKLVEIYPSFTFLQILIISVMAGFGEELLMRGIAQAWLTQYLGGIAGIFIASLLFGVLHYLSVTYIVFAFLLGVLFGAVFHLTQDLLLVMVAHAVYDVFAFISLGKINTEIYKKT